MTYLNFKYAFFLGVFLNFGIFKQKIILMWDTAHMSNLTNLLHILSQIYYFFLQKYSANIPFKN